jgi:hypothetical protein
VERRLGTVAGAGAGRCLDVRFVRGEEGQSARKREPKTDGRKQWNLNEGTKEIHPVVLCVTGGSGDGLWNLWSNRSGFYRSWMVRLRGLI